MVAQVTLARLSYIHWMRDPQLSLVPPEAAMENHTLALQELVLPQACQREAGSPDAHALHSGYPEGNWLHEALTSPCVELAPSVSAQLKCEEHKPLCCERVV
jgi:hypothetical protein